MNPQFPLYIVSKGRWESRLTAKYLTDMGCDFRIIVEEQERDAYAAVIDPARVLVLDPEYQRRYDTFSAVGADKGTGSGPARNFAWDHSRSLGFSWHWCMDDNIRGWYRLNKNLKVPVSDGTVFRCMEDFCLRYENISMAGPNYFMFASRKSRIPPFVANTRIYSCNLIRNDVPFRWRGRYNEDTDLSLRMLKAGWCTVLFNAFLQFKSTTLTMKGGNAEIYSIGTLAKSQMLVDMHPDVTTLAHKFKRAHHHVDYSRFRWNALRLRPGFVAPDGVDDYGMRLIHLEKGAGEGAAGGLQEGGPGEGVLDPPQG